MRQLHGFVNHGWNMLGLQFFYDNQVEFRVNGRSRTGGIRFD